MRFSLTSTGFIMPTHIEAIRRAGGELVGLNTNEDCVVINSPNHLHYKHIKEHLDKIVLVEKPLVIDSKQAKELAQYDNIYTIFQLRYHPLLKKIKIKERNEIEMDISVYRDDKYFNGWKGDDEKSGGIMFNLGIHYFDILFHLFGKPISSVCDNDIRMAQGLISGANYRCLWKLSVNEKKDNQRRIFKINGKEYNFSAKDNLAYENLHRYVYKDLIKGKGVKAKEVAWLTEFIENLK